MKPFTQNGRTGHRLLAILLAVVLLAVTIPAVNAYESHLINVKVHVKERFNVFKTMRLATPQEIASAIASGVRFPGTPNPSGVTSPSSVPIFTCIAWIVELTAQNPHTYPITNVTVGDNFSAELGAEPLSSLPVDLTIIWHTAGKAKQKQFPTQYRIDWFVTYISGDLDDPESIDNSGVMQPGESQTLTMMVWTKLNPSGRQEYTSPGTYTLNSGPVMKWYDLDGHKFSFEGEQLNVTAYR